MKMCGGVETHHLLLISQLLDPPVPLPLLTPWVGPRLSFDVVTKIMPCFIRQVLY